MANSVKRKQLSNTDISWLKGYIGTIQKTVLTFYSKIESSYSGYSNILYSQSAKDEKVKINELIKQISRLIAAGRGQQSFIDEIYDHVAQMYENLSEFVSSTKSDTEFAKQVKNSHINVDSEIKNQNKILGRIENLGEKKSGESNYLPTNLKDLAWTAAYALPPIGIAAKFGVEAYKAGRSGLNWAKRKISDFADNRKINSSSSDKKASPLGRAMSATPFDLGETIQEASESEGIGPITSSMPGELRSPTGQYARGNTPWNKRITPQSVETSGTLGTSKEKIGLVDNFEHGLFKFFSTTAKRAPYLKELLEAVQEKGPKKTKEEKSGKEDKKGILDTISNLAKYGPFGLIAAGIGMGLWDAFKAQSVAKQQGWLGKPGEDLHGGQKVAAGVGGFMGGTGPGVFDKGTIAQKAKNVGWGAVKGGLIGGGIGAIPGALETIGVLASAPFTGGASLALLPATLGHLASGFAVGAGTGALIGAGTHAIGGKKISQGIQATTRILSGQDIATGEKIKSQNPYGNLGDIPAENFQATSSQDIKDGLNKLYTGISEVGNILKEGSKNVSRKLPSGYDANNTRNPILSSLGAGILDVA